MKAISNKAVLFLLLICLMAVSRGYAGDDSKPPADPNAKGYDALLEQAKDAFKKDKDKFRFEPVNLPDHLTDAKIQSAYRKAWQDYYEYLSIGLAYRMKVFRWQALSTIIIFYTVLILVFSGILFSGIQFYKSMKLSGVKGLEGKPDQTLTEFEASASGIKISSPVLGVVILVISLVFFYLYLVHVYPIQEIF